MSQPQSLSLPSAAVIAESIPQLRGIAERGQLWLPGIDFAPQKMRAQGYREAHSWPLVARHKGEAFRVHASKAWAFPSIELRTANSWPCLILDCDNPEAALAAIYTTHRAFGGTALPMPHWIVQRRETMHLHLIWCLIRAVLRGAQARSSPLRRFARISEFYRQASQADAGFNGVLSHNPMCGGSRSSGRALITTWGRREPYSLDELAEAIPQGWRMPRLPTTETGRNCSLFMALMRWSGMPRNWGVDVLDQALALNALFDPPMGYGEVIGIAKSVNKYQARQLASGQTQQQFSFIQSERGRKGGRRSKRGPDPSSERSRKPWEAKGISRPTEYRRRKKHKAVVQARQERLDHRNAAIRADRAAGLSLRALAAKHGLSKSQVYRLIPGVPLCETR